MTQRIFSKKIQQIILYNNSCQKKKIRKRILELRKQKFTKQYKINCNLVLKLIKKFELKRPIIGGYYPVNYEIDCLEILNFLERKKYLISLPVIKIKNSMKFFKWSSNDPLKISKYGIPEPFGLKSVDPDILLVPIVAFDKNFYRVGYGGGYYDRFISKIKKKKEFLLLDQPFLFKKQINLMLISMIKSLILS